MNFFAVMRVCDVPTPRFFPFPSIPFPSNSSFSLPLSHSFPTSFHYSTYTMEVLCIHRMPSCYLLTPKLLRCVVPKFFQVSGFLPFGILYSSVSACDSEAVHVSVLYYGSGEEFASFSPIPFTDSLLSHAVDSPPVRPATRRKQNGGNGDTSSASFGKSCGLLSRQTRKTQV